MSALASELRELDVPWETSLGASGGNAQLYEPGGEATAMALFRRAFDLLKTHEVNTGVEVLPVVIDDFAHGLAEGRAAGISQLVVGLGSVEHLVNTLSQTTFGAFDPYMVTTGIVSAGTAIRGLGYLPYAASGLGLPRPESITEWIRPEPVNVYRAARSYVDQSRYAALTDIRQRLDNARAAYAQRAPRDVAADLITEIGVGQLVTARAVGVTPTAVRKWQRGESARPEHRDGLARVAALFSMLLEVGVHDPAGWIDIPISDESTLTPLDLFVRGRGDLAVLLGAIRSDPQEILDDFDASWRTTYAPDPDYEVVRLSDGSRSAVPRQ
jgi:hypothetical protein